MVSYPDEMAHPTAAPPPYSHHHHHQRSHSTARAPSVASSSRTSTTVRRHHHHHHHHRERERERERERSRDGSHHRPSSRSRAGVSSASSSSSHGYANEFPVFERSGDVEIVLASGRREARYVLHSLYLKQSSAWFEDVLGSDLGAGGLGGRRVRFELDWAAGGDMPLLMLMPLSPTERGPRPPPTRPKPPAPSNGFFRTMANISSLHIGRGSSNDNNPSQTVDPADDVFLAYDNLFRIMYNHAPRLSTDQIALAYTESKSLLLLASSYHALPVIGPRIDHHLLRFGSRLWKQIAKYPPSYLKLGLLARSRAIFAEALVHVVGQWPAAEPALLGAVPLHVVHLIEDKQDDALDLRQRVDAKLWRLTLTTTRGERVAPASAWLDWLVVCLWRQWFAEHTTPAPVGILKDPATAYPPGSSGSGGGRGARGSGPLVRSGSAGNGVNWPRVYRLLGMGGQAYLPHDEVKRFLKLTPESYSRENLRRVERRLEEMKNLAREAVRPLTRNFLELDLREGGLPYFTCVRVAEGEWPWDD